MLYDTPTPSPRRRESLRFYQPALNALKEHVNENVYVRLLGKAAQLGEFMTPRATLYPSLKCGRIPPMRRGIQRRPESNITAQWTKFLITLSTMVWPLARRASRNYGRLPRLPAAGCNRSLPSISIIIPARNEAANLPALLGSLEAMEYDGSREIIVVDDDSTDATDAIAAANGAQVITLRDLPPGWLGKPYACDQGARAATGDWLLFTDADTVHSARGAADAVSYAVQHDLHGLSLFLKHETSGFLEQSALSTAYAGLFAGMTPGAPLLNGQYILLRRDVYLASGGFAAVRGELLEDLALGRQLRTLGYAVPIMSGEEAARVHMYADIRQMWHGIARLSSGSLRWSGVGAFVAPLFVILSTTPILALTAVLTRRVSWKWGLYSWLTTIFGFLPWARRFGATQVVVLAPVGAHFVQFAAAWGLLRKLLGKGLRWRERAV